VPAKVTWEMHFFLQIEAKCSLLLQEALGPSGLRAEVTPGGVIQAAMRGENRQSGGDWAWEMRQTECPGGSRRAWLKDSVFRERCYRERSCFWQPRFSPLLTTLSDTH